MAKYRQVKPVSDADAYKSLPHNRKEVFFDLLRHRKMTLLGLSFYTFMFFIPLAVDLILFNFIENAAIASDNLDHLFSLIFYSMVIMIPCMVIGFIGLAGAFYAVKKLVWQEGTMFASDFLHGIKANWKQAVIDGFLFGIILFGFVVGGSFLLIHVDLHPVVRGIGLGGLILVMLTFGMIIPLNFTQNVYYANPYTRTFKNSFAFLGLLHWKVLVTFLLSTGALIAMCCFNFIVLIIGLFLFALLNSVVIVIYTLLSHDVFDKYINKEHYPDMVGKGLYKDNKEA